MHWLVLQGYAQKISHCLLVITQMGRRADVMRELQTWTCECASLILFLAVGHLKNFIAFCSSRLDGQMGPTVNQLSDAWYQEYTVRAKPYKHCATVCLGKACS